jgi:DNA-binding NarL/FixJ family response regulator
METLRILLADDHSAVRRSLRFLLESQPQWEVCFEAKTGREAVEQARLLKPDVVVLDIRMPELNGLEAARQILRQTPGPRLFLLSTQPSDELTDEARRAGAEGVILKSDGHMLTAAIYSFIRETTAIHLASAELTQTRHVGAFFGSDEERYRILGPFVAEGLTRGEKAVHIVDSGDREAHVRRLMNAAVDVDAATAQGQMEIFPWEEMYLRGGHFDQSAMIDRMQQTFHKTAEEGFPLTRLVANMEWALLPPSSVEELVQYESRLNDVLPSFEDVVICVYDLGKFDGGVIIDIMRTHPAVLLGGSFRENPFYLAPEPMLEELRQRKEEQHRSKPATTA